MSASALSCPTAYGAPWTSTGPDPPVPYGRLSALQRCLLSRMSMRKSRCQEGGGALTAPLQSRAGKRGQGCQEWKPTLRRRGLRSAPSHAVTESLRVPYRRCVARGPGRCDHGSPGGGLCSKAFLKLLLTHAVGFHSLAAPLPYSLARPSQRSVHLADLRMAIRQLRRRQCPPYTGVEAGATVYLLFSSTAPGSYRWPPLHTRLARPSCCAEPVGAKRARPPPPPGMAAAPKPGMIAEIGGSPTVKNLA
jgi:hypothetical protein